jgi:hypothetical protein
MILGVTVVDPEGLGFGIGGSGFKVQGSDFLQGSQFRF